MDGRLFTVIAFLALPALLMGLTVAFFRSNPVSIFVLIAVMLVGSIYLLTYKETFA
ncbi:MAG: hypothetical protein ACLQD9_03665 [Thermoplasmata archaeon]|nr:hypothetical protein [Thermoplasmata archaeon]